VADRCDDNQIIHEAGLITELNIGGVFAENEELLTDFGKKYNIEMLYSNFDELIEKNDIIYIHCREEDRYGYIKEALKAKKHVICDAPFTLSKKKQIELFELAKENNVALWDNIKMVYVRVFNQLLWMTQGGLIGDIIRFECSVSKNDKAIKDLFNELMANAICPMIKVLGSDYNKMTSKLIKQDSGVEFGALTFEYPTCEATIKVGNSVRVKNQMEIIGTKGTIRLKDNWWKSNYFELEEPDSTESIVYNMNFEGNGFKFLLREMLTMFANENTESKGLFPDESIKIVEIMEEVYNS